MADRAIRTSAWTEAGFHLVALDFLFHVIEKTPLTCFDVLQGDLGRAAAGRAAARNRPAVSSSSRHRMNSIRRWN